MVATTITGSVQCGAYPKEGIRTTHNPLVRASLGSVQLYPSLLHSQQGIPELRRQKQTRQEGGDSGVS